MHDDEITDLSKVTPRIAKSLWVALNQERLDVGMH